MSRNILLTSLSAAESTPPLRYFSIRNEFGFDYCDAVLDAEAGIKAVLARYKIDEIIVAGEADTFDEKDSLTPCTLREGSTLYSADRTSFSTYRLLRYRLAQYADELSLDLQAEDGAMPAEVRAKLTRFVREFHEGNEGLRAKKVNRLFDALAQEGETFEQFQTALFEAFPEFRDYLPDCRFTTCSHTCEKGCAVCAAVERGEISQSRHKSYCTLYEEAKAQKPWEL